MNLPELVDALLNHDALRARAWVGDAQRLGFEWKNVPKPEDGDPVSLAVAAGIVELLAQRSRQDAPEWTKTVQASPEAVFLVRSAASMPRLRRSCELEGPEPLRRRRVFAPPDFLTAA